MGLFKGLFGTKVQYPDPSRWVMNDRGLLDTGDDPAMNEPTRAPSFWQGGDKFTGRDAAAGLLAAVGDAFANQAEMPGGAVGMLTGNRSSALEKAEKAAQDRALQAAAQRQGIGADEFALYRGGLGAAIPKPPGPNDTERDYDFYQRTLTPEQFEQWKRNRIYDPPRYLQGPDGQYYPAPSRSGPPAITEDDWNAAGGGGGNATGGFPPRYRR